jgi:hypothetical protein
MKKNSIKYHVGKFSLTDKNSAFVVSAKVEQGEKFIDGLFFIELFSFDEKVQSISIAFNAVELRVFANQLEELRHGVISMIKKHSGGSKSDKRLTLCPSTQSESILVEFTQSNNRLLFQIQPHMLYGLSKQLEHLIDTTMDAVYKTQQFMIRKKVKNGK